MVKLKTPHTVTNKSPYELMFNRVGNVRWKLLAPDCRDEIEIRNIEKKFEINDMV